LAVNKRDGCSSPSVFSQVPWGAEFPGYVPREWTAEFVLTKGVQQKWADPEDAASISNVLRQVKNIYICIYIYISIYLYVNNMEFVLTKGVEKKLADPEDAASISNVLRQVIYIYIQLNINIYLFIYLYIHMHMHI